MPISAARWKTRVGSPAPRAITDVEVADVARQDLPPGRSSPSSQPRVPSEL